MLVLSLVCEIRIICVILSFQIGSNLVGVSNSTLHSNIVKKSAFYNWSYNRFFLLVTIRVLKVIRFITLSALTKADLAGVS